MCLFASAFLTYSTQTGNKLHFMSVIHHTVLYGGCETGGRGGAYLVRTVAATPAPTLPSPTATSGSPLASLRTSGG